MVEMWRKWVKIAFETLDYKNISDSCEILEEMGCMISDFYERHEFRP